MRILPCLVSALLLALGMPHVSAQRPAGVPENATSFEGHWYLPISAATISAEAAQAACEKFGGYLAVVNSPAEHAFLKSLVADAPQVRFWLGGRRDSTGAWHWSQAGKDTALAKHTVALVRRGPGPLHLALRDASHQRDLAALAPAPTDLSVAGYLCEWGDAQTFSAAPSPQTPAAPSGKRVAIAAGTASLRTILRSDNAKAFTLATLNARAAPGPAGSGLHLELDSGNASTTSRNALNEIIALLRLRHGRGIDATIKISAVPSEEEFDIDPGSALAWALLADSLIRDEPLHPNAIVLGDINADGQVQPDPLFFQRFSSPPIGVVTGAEFGVPGASEPLLRDLLIRGEFATIATNSLVRLTTFDSALSFVAALPSPATAKASAEFADLGKLYQSRPANFAATIAHPKLREKLKSIVAAQPDHLSADLLLTAARGALGDTLSPEGSVALIAEIANPILVAAQATGFPSDLQGAGEPYVKSISELRQVRSKLDRSTHPVTDQLILLGGLIERWVEAKPRSRNGRADASEKLIATRASFQRANALLDTSLLQGSKK